MCNRLHNDSKKIPVNGFAWKIFKIKDKELLSCCGNYYESDKSGWVRWINRNLTLDEELEMFGFCGFLDKKIALKTKKDWEITSPNEKYIILKIQYKYGLGKHIERGIIMSQEYEICLFREFKVMSKRYKFK